jgi:hypothetical protein
MIYRTGVTRRRDSACRRNLDRWTTGLLIAGLLLARAATSATRADDESGFRPLFDGQSLAGWRGYQGKPINGSWTVVDGMIQGNGQGPDLVTDQEFADFEVRFEWKLAARGNSGVIYHAAESLPESYQSGLEYQLLDDSAFREQLAPLQATASIYGLYANRDETPKPAGQFNSGRIVAHGGHREHWLNDELVAECEIGSEDWRQRIAASKFRAWPEFAKRPAGRIALQSHGGQVWFRNIRIKEVVDR